MTKPYILLTAAKNEEAYIGITIESVLQQTALPMAWFIMDDGSTDQTAKIVAEYATRHPFIHLHAGGEGQRRNFGSQYKALAAAYELARNMDFEFVGVHDADIAPEHNNYYASLLELFAQRPRLGIAGGYIHERSRGAWVCRKSNSRDSVAGGIQMFRRECFQQIGGYTPLYLGGSDWLAQLDASMAGWDIQACPNLPVKHYRPTSSANGRWRGWVHLGYLDASFGTHPLFELFKCLRRMTVSPAVIAATVRFGGYLWWTCARRHPLLPPEKVAFLRKQQMAKIGSQIFGLKREPVALPKTAIG